MTFENRQSPFDNSLFRKWTEAPSRSETGAKASLTVENYEVKDGFCFINFQLFVHNAEALFGYVLLKTKRGTNDEVVYSLKISRSGQYLHLKIPIESFSKYLSPRRNTQAEFYLLALVGEVELFSRIFTLTFPPLPPTEFNSYYARRILDRIVTGAVGFNAKRKPDEQLREIIKGNIVKGLDPRKVFIQIFPLLDSITSQAETDGYDKIVIGSFIRPVVDENKKGHPEGRCIDINLRLETTPIALFTQPEAVDLVKYVLDAILRSDKSIRKGIGFGLPYQGDFIVPKTGVYRKTKGIPEKKISDPELTDKDIEAQIKKLGGVFFPDNHDHLHIQVDGIAVPSWLHLHSSEELTKSG